MSRQISVNQMIVIIFFTLSQPFRKSALRTIDSFSHNGFSPGERPFQLVAIVFFPKFSFLSESSGVFANCCKMGFKSAREGVHVNLVQGSFFTAVVLLKRHTIWYHAPHCKKSSSRNLFIWVNVLDTNKLINIKCSLSLAAIYTRCRQVILYLEVLE